MTIRIKTETQKDEQAPAVVSVGHLLISGSTVPEAPLPLHGARTIVGRQDADLTVDDPALSGHHFAIDCPEKGQFLIRDLESTNGTRVNGQPIQTSPLQSGDTIEAGQTTFVFRTLATVAWQED